MGSIISPPKAPKIVPVATPQPAADANKDADAEASKQLEELLDRRRAHQSTIMTSYRGVLQDTPLAPQRKTLLGE